MQNVVCSEFTAIYLGPILGSLFMYEFTKDLKRSFVLQQTKYHSKWGGPLICPPPPIIKILWRPNSMHDHMDLILVIFNSDYFIRHVQHESIRVSYCRCIELTVSLTKIFVSLFTTNKATKIDRFEKKYRGNESALTSSLYPTFVIITRTSGLASYTI
jgi:hypothetical protein